MSAPQLVSGPFNAMYLGSALATGTALAQLSSVDTGDYVVVYNAPKSSKFIRAINGYAITDFAKITVTISFIGDNAETIKLAMGNLLTVLQQDQPPGNATYSIFLLDSLHVGSSIWIPKCQSIGPFKDNRSKKSQTQIDLTFQWEDRDNQVNLYYKRDNASLKTLMALQSPI